MQRKWTRRTALAAGAVSLVVLSSTAASAESPTTTWPTQELAPGVQVRTGVLGHDSGEQRWTVTVRVQSRSDAPPAELGEERDANATAGRLEAAGFQPRVEQVDWPGFADTPHGPLGWRVRVGDFDTQQQAKDEAAAITAAGFRAAADWTGYDGEESGGPVQVHIAIVDPHQFTGEVRASYGQAVSGRETTSAMSAAAGALVGVNAGFFVMDGVDGIPGDPAGIGVYGGVLQHEATNGRVSLKLGTDGRPASIDNVTTTMTVHSGDADRAINGVNRTPGLIRNCGQPGDVPTALPLHDVTCTNPDELALLTPQLGGQPPAGPGVEAVLDDRGTVTELRARGGAVPANGRVLQGIGNGASWLDEHARPGTALRIDEQIQGTRGPIEPAGDMVNGGPWLVRDGQEYVDAAAEGLVHPGDPSFTYAWAVRRNPRTMAGIDREGRLLLVTVDGRQPGRSAGFSLTEGARFMRSLGAVSAMNLDGGGSTAMAINGKLVNTPSDATGERAVGDALVVVPHR